MDDRAPKFDEVQWPELLTYDYRKYPGAVYCRHCITIQRDGKGWMSMSGMKHHLEQVHGYYEDHEEGWHYFGGVQLQRLLEEYWLECYRMIRVFEWQLSTIVGIDDFLADCGA